MKSQKFYYDWAIYFHFWKHVWIIHFFISVTSLFRWTVVDLLFTHDAKAKNLKRVHYIFMTNNEVKKKWMRFSSTWLVAFEEKRISWQFEEKMYKILVARIKKRLKIRHLDAEKASLHWFKRSFGCWRFLRFTFLKNHFPSLFERAFLSWSSWSNFIVSDQN